MHCLKHISDNLIWVGANDRRLAMFEGVYSVPDGVSYNSYLMFDEKNVLFDTVDKAVMERFMENIEEALSGRSLDYLILQHIEPDHSAAVGCVLAKYPDVILVLNEKSSNFLDQFFRIPKNTKRLIVKEGETLNTGKHTFHFVNAPMVHWPEVMVTYESSTKTLFSADAFGSFGALNGAIFADEVNFERDYLDEARRYYTNIVGKYGPQVQTLLKKASGLEINMICPLHGFVWRKNFNEIIKPYLLWSSYEPEEEGVMIAYASVYGNTENAAELLSSHLRNMGVKTVMFDVSVTPASEIVAAAFKWSHHVYASTTYNAGIFVTMEALIYDIVAHNIQNRTIALIENGSWAATSGKEMRAKFEQCKNMSFVGDVNIKSSVSTDKAGEIKALADAIADTMPKWKSSKEVKANTKSIGVGNIDGNALWKIPYGLFLVTAKDGEKDNGCIVNTFSQDTFSPLQVSVIINKENYTHDMIQKTGLFAISVLTESTPFSLFKEYGFSTGREVNKFDNVSNRTKHGLPVVLDHANSTFEGKVVSSFDCNTHTIFLAEVTEAVVVSNEKSCTYDYYLKNIKPAPDATPKNQKGFVCKICGYVYEGEILPDDYICPLCKHGAIDFEEI